MFFRKNKKKDSEPVTESYFLFSHRFPIKEAIESAMTMDFGESDAENVLPDPRQSASESNAVTHQALSILENLESQASVEPVSEAEDVSADEIVLSEPLAFEIHGAESLPPAGEEDVPPPTQPMEFVMEAPQYQDDLGESTMVQAESFEAPLQGANASEPLSLEAFLALRSDAMAAQPDEVNTVETVSASNVAEERPFVQQIHPSEIVEFASEQPLPQHSSELELGPESQEQQAWTLASDSQESISQEQAFSEFLENTLGTTRQDASSTYHVTEPLGMELMAEDALVEPFAFVQPVSDFQALENQDSVFITSDIAELAYSFALVEPPGDSEALPPENDVTADEPDTFVTSSSVEAFLKPEDVLLQESSSSLAASSESEIVGVPTPSDVMMSAPEAADDEPLVSVVRPVRATPKIDDLPIWADAFVSKASPVPPPKSGQSPEDLRQVVSDTVSALSSFSPRRDVQDFWTIRKQPPAPPAPSRRSSIALFDSVGEADAGVENLESSKAPVAGDSDFSQPSSIEILQGPVLQVIDGGALHLTPGYQEQESGASEESEQQEDEIEQPVRASVVHMQELRRAPHADSWEDEDDDSVKEESPAPSEEDALPDNVVPFSLPTSESEYDTVILGDSEVPSEASLNPLAEEIPSSPQLDTGDTSHSPNSESNSEPLSLWPVDSYLSVSEEPDMGLMPLLDPIQALSMAPSYLIPEPSDSQANAEAGLMPVNDHVEQVNYASAAITNEDVPDNIDLPDNVMDFSFDDADSVFSGLTSSDAAIPYSTPSDIDPLSNPSQVEDMAFELPETEHLDGVAILASDWLSEELQVMLVYHDGVYALMVDNGVNAALLKSFDDNPLLPHNHFTVTQEAIIGNKAMFIVQVGTWQGIISLESDEAKLQAEM